MQIATLMSSRPSQGSLRLIGLLFFVAGLIRTNFGQSDVPRTVRPLTEEILGRKPRNHYGSLEGPMRSLRANRVCGEPVHPVIAKHRATCTSGRPLADWFDQHLMRAKQ